MNDRTRWEERYAAGERADRAPSGWVVDTVLRLPNGGLVCDLAGGSGRHAVPIAGGGRDVVLVDFVEGAVRRAITDESAVHGVVADVARLPFRSGSFGAIVVVNFLDRALFPVLADLLAPGGALVYETYTRAHLELVEAGLARGPSSLAYLLESEELPALVGSLRVLAYHEGEVNDGAGRRRVARMVARRS